MKVTAVTPFVVDPGYGKSWLFVKVETSDGLSPPTVPRGSCGWPR
jgi:hypothetical protein